MKFKISTLESGVLVWGTDFSLNFTTSARVHGTWTREDLQSALERLCLRHPLMATRVAPATEDAPACFTTEDVPAIPLRIVERTLDDDWAREVEREIITPTNYATGPFVRCVWVRGQEFSDLVLVSDHITGDGLAGVYALRTLLELLADPTLKPEPIIPPNFIDVIPPAILAKMQEAISASTTTFVPETPPDPSEPRPVVEPPCIIPFAFEAAETSALISRCRAEGATVQAALSTAFSLCFAEIHPDAPIRRIESPINLRPHLLPPVVGEIYGNYISLICTDLDCTPGKSPWDIARAFKQSLHTVSDEQLFVSPIVMFAVADVPFTGEMDNNYDISISNLGRVNIPTQYGALRLESIYAPTIGPVGPEHRILGVTTFNGQMRCTFSSRDPQAPQIIQRAREILAQMLLPAS